MKAAILKSLELVPEAYRQRFWTQGKKENQSYVELLRDKENALEKWCDYKRIEGDVEKLQQLILVKEFLNCVPEEIRFHLSGRKNDLSYEMAALAVDYTLTHRKTKERIYTGSQGNRMKFKAELSPEEKPKEEIEETSRETAEQGSAINVEKLDI